MTIIATFCSCTGAHVKDCALGKRLSIKYHPTIQKIWDLIGPEDAENLIDKLVELISEEKRA